jgi:hypothetical protein
MPPTYTDEGARAGLETKQRHPEVGGLVLSRARRDHPRRRSRLAGRIRIYLLKDRVLEVGEFLATAQRIAAGGSALDPKVVARLVSPATGSYAVVRLSA